ncbi:hypothetical protein GCM10023108_55840 [Saccharopolyspora hordei]
MVTAPPAPSGAVHLERQRVTVDVGAEGAQRVQDRAERALAACGSPSKVIRPVASAAIGARTA